VEHAVTAVRPGSIADELSIEPGDVLLSVNGCDVADVLDYRRLTAGDNIELRIRKPGGEIIYEIEKDESEDIGLEFATFLMDNMRLCANGCLFCFIDQLPPGMRPGLYIKDDDPRLSFLHGNYATLTNLDNAELARLIDSRLSPVNISVHTTDPALRIMMTGNPRAGDIMDKIAMIADARLTMNFQVVLCKGINDGPALDKTIGDLANFYPYGNSLSVVPVGLTKHRGGLRHIEPYTTEDARGIISQVSAWQKKLRSAGSRFVYAADELYILAGLPIPGYAGYEGFPQLENGVGMLALFKREASDVLRRARCNGGPKTVDVVTGVAAHGFIEGIARDVMNKFPQVTVKTHIVDNKFFGGGVTVSGLLTGRDIIDALKGRLTGDTLLVPANALKAGTEIFLDDVIISDVSAALNTRATACAVNGRAFVKAVLKG